MEGRNGKIKALQRRNYFFDCALVAKVKAIDGETIKTENGKILE